MSRLMPASSFVSTLTPARSMSASTCDERHLHRLVDREQALGFEPLLHRLREPQHELGLAARGARGGKGGGVRGREAVGSRRAPLAEVLHRDVLERVGAAAGVEQVAREQRVEAEGRDLRRPAARARPGRAWRVPRPWGAPRPPAAGAAPRSHPCAKPPAADRSPSGRAVRSAERPGGPGERDPERVGSHRLLARHDDAEREPARGARFPHQLTDVRRRHGQAVLGGDVRQLRRELARQHLELELLEERVGGRVVGADERETGHVELHRHVAAQRHQLLREQRLGAVRLQPLPVGRALHLVGVLEHRLDRAELAHQVARALVADPGDAGDVVDRVADEREHVHDPLGRNAPLLLDGLAVVARRAGAVAARVQHAHVVLYELKQVLVGGDHHDPDPALARLAHERRDHVVGLEAGHLDERHAQRLADAPDVGQLQREVLVHRRRGSPCSRRSPRGGRSCRAGRTRPRCARASRPPAACAAWW